MAKVYYPYFRGKQNELITIRETAKLMAESGFVPILEPVKGALNGLARALERVVAARGDAVVIVNPTHGAFSRDGTRLSQWLCDNFADSGRISAGVLLKSNMSVSEAIQFRLTNTRLPLAMIHAGFSDAKDLVDALGGESNSLLHVFMEASCGKLYQKHFKPATRVLVRDGFHRMKNKEYPEVEPFSDLHATFPMEGVDGFGDFLIVGDDFSETGGPAYAVAIHLTFIDGDKDDAMYIYHFMSDRQETPTDPAGKFGEALDKLVEKLREPGSKVLPTKAVKEFRELHAVGHYPGLGYVKKLSMQHHIETLAAYFRK